MAYNPNPTKNEDDASANLDAGVPILAIRKATPADTSGADGDYEMLQIKDGKLYTQENGPIVSTDDTSTHTPGTTKAVNIAQVADETSTDLVDEGDLAIPRITLNRQQIVTVRPNASGEGLDIHHNIDVDETEDAVKASAGKVYGWYIYNNGAAVVYVKLYDATVATVVVGTTVPTMTIPIPAGSAANVEYTNGIPFATAITIAATTGVTTADVGAPALNQVVANIFYK